MSWHAGPERMEVLEPERLIEKMRAGKIIYDPIYGVLVDTETGVVIERSVLPGEYIPTKAELYGTRYAGPEEFVHHAPLGRLEALKMAAYEFLAANGYIDACREGRRIDLDSLAMSASIRPSILIHTLKEHGCRPGAELPGWTAKLAYGTKHQNMAVDFYYKVKRELGLDPCAGDVKLYIIGRRAAEAFGLTSKQANTLLNTAVRVICPEKLESLIHRKKGRWRRLCPEILRAGREELRRIAEREGVKLQTLYVWRHRCRREQAGEG